MKKAPAKTTFKEDGDDETILSKYKAPAARADNSNRTELEEKKKRALKEKQRSIGRKVPSRGNEDHERGLVLIATKGVVQLFNTVSEF